MLTRQGTLPGPKNLASAGSSGTPDTYAAADPGTITRTGRVLIATDIASHYGLNANPATP